MKITPRRYRQLLTVYVILLMLIGVAPFLPMAALPLDLHEAWERLPPPAWIPDSIATTFLLAALLIPLVIAQIVGLYLFRRWARTLSTVLTVLVWPLLLFTGPSVQSALEVVLSDVTSVLWGALLALAWASPVSRRFGGQPDASPDLPA